MNKIARDVKISTTSSKGLTQKIDYNDLLIKTKVNYKKTARLFDLNRTVSLEIIKMSDFRVIVDILISDREFLTKMLFYAVNVDEFIKTSAVCNLATYLEENKIVLLSDFEKMMEISTFNQGLYFATAITLMQEVFRKIESTGILLGMYIQTDLSKRAFNRCDFLIDLVAYGLKDCVEVFGTKIS